MSLSPPAPPAAPGENGALPVHPREAWCGQLAPGYTWVTAGLRTWALGGRCTALTTKLRMDLWKRVPS